MINWYVLYANHTLIANSFLDYSIDKNDIVPSSDQIRPRCITKMHLCLKVQLRCKVFARLNDCSNWDEVDVTFVQTQKSQSLYCRTCSSNYPWLLTMDKIVNRFYSNFDRFELSIFRGSVFKPCEMLVHFLLKFLLNILFWQYACTA